MYLILSRDLKELQGIPHNVDTRLTIVSIIAVLITGFNHYYYITHKGLLIYYLIIYIIKGLLHLCESVDLSLNFTGKVWTTYA